MKKDLKKLMSIKRKEAVQMRNNQKGITLIALIITIIVMLILVAVTISVALNGGIFNNAREAQEQTRKAATKEELVSAMVGAYDSTGSFNKNNVELPEDVIYCSEEEIEENTSYDDIEQDQSTPTNWLMTKDGDVFFIDGKGSIFEKDKVWQGRGLTSSNVVFDKDYYCALLNNSIVICSNGGWIMGDLEDPDDKGASSDIQEEGIESGMVLVGTNYIVINLR